MRNKTWQMGNKTAMTGSKLGSITIKISTWLIKIVSDCAMPANIWHHVYFPQETEDFFILNEENPILDIELWGICKLTLNCINRTQILLFTHWGRVTHICVGNLTIISSDNGLSPGRRQTITWTNVGILLIRPLGTNFSEMLIKKHTFSFKKIHLKMSSGKWRPFCLDLSVLICIHWSLYLAALSHEQAQNKPYKIIVKWDREVRHLRIISHYKSRFCQWHPQ